MSRLAVLKIEDGDFDKGFVVWLQIFKDGVQLTQIKGELPPKPEIEGLYISWQTVFRSLRSSYQDEQNYQRGNNDDWQVDKSLVTNRFTSEGVEACRQFVICMETSIQNWLQRSPAQGWGKIRERLVKELDNQADGIQVILQTSDSLLWKLHWYVWDLLENYPDIGISFSLPEFEKPEIVKKIVTENHLVRILAVFGDDRNINLQPDWEKIDNLEGAEPVPLRQPKAQKLIETLREKKGWDIFFFAGHSQTERDTGRIYINESESLEIDQFKNALKEASRNGLKIAIFNSCDGLGLAKKLASLQIPVIIVMQDVVPDIVAQSFLKEFLSEYAEGQPLHTAVRRAQARLEKFTDLPGATWLPVILQSHLEVPPTWKEFLIKAKGSSVEFDSKFPYDQYRVIPLAPPPLPRKPKLLAVLLASLIITILLVGLRSHSVLEPLELWAYDRFMQLKSVPPLDKRILIVAVNDEDVNVKQFKKPLSDRVVTQLLTKLEKYQPQVIGLDIQRPEATGGTKADWENLGKHIQNSVRPIIAICDVGEVNRQYQPLRAKASPPGVSSERIGFSDALIRDTNPDNYIVRRYSLIMDLRRESLCSTLYSFSFQVVRHYLSPQTQYRYNPGDNLRIDSIVLKSLKPDSGGYQRPKNDMQGYQILIDYSPSRQVAQEVSLTDIMNNSDSDLLQLIQNRIVLIGYVTSNSPDYHSTPVGKMHGVKIHAHVVSQLLNTVENHHSLLSSWSKISENIWILVWSIMGGILTLLFRFIKHLIVVISLGISGIFVICFSYFSHAVWVPLIPAALGLVVSSYVAYYLTKRDIKISLISFKSSCYRK
ncbi:MULTISPECIES: CHASE2 domain-containing protein [Cyanophyceae]|uniref:CHASE2 domain-containing protein n=1 Tax=Cyanophyceae TaxID=3028117 RepID=UPI0016834C38|nr:CHASE2 domain-containing protein [Trichocoleus sp. FACHB-40]MBD2002740.1 CHASE2 domain-containing protein [Trichocoleus sp. FACHB-40]